MKMKIFTRQDIFDGIGTKSDKGSIFISVGDETDIGKRSYYWHIDIQVYAGVLEIGSDRILLKKEPGKRYFDGIIVRKK